MSGCVPPSSRAGKPLRASRGAISRAADLYSRFSGHNSESLGRVNVPDLPKVAAVVGECDAINYTCVRDGVEERYTHRFRKSDKPLLCVDPTGKQLLLIGGDYVFTELGIVDGSDKKHLAMLDKDG